MAYTNIDKPEDFFSATLYTGDGSADQSMTGAGFKPDFLWIKRRNASERHVLTNVQMGVSDGAYKWLDSAATNAEFSGGTGVAAFDADGFSIKTSDTTWNASGSTYVFWSWKANGGTTTAFSESGNNPGGTYQANTTAGFSIVTYTGTGAAGTVTHGLGVAPKLIIIKNRDVADPWAVYYGDATDYLVLNTTAATVDNAAWWNDTAPSSTVFTVNTDHSVNADAETYIAYCFAEKQGYSKFGKYVGNDQDPNGVFVYTGFKPAFLLVKRTDATGSWVMWDTKRSPTNDDHGDVLLPDSSQAESAGNNSNALDFLSNGFKFRGGANGVNGPSSDHIYMAFAENPFVTSTGIPATAR